MDLEYVVRKLGDDISYLRRDIKEVVTNGCAKREGDVNAVKAVKLEVEELKDGIKKLYHTSLVTALGIIAFLIKAFIWPLIVKVGG